VPAPERKVGSLRSRIAGLQLVTDLGAGIGSRDWWRGATTCVALCYVAFSFSPGMEPMIGASPAPVPEENWDELQALSISPLALGADTGRRMGPTDVVMPLLNAPERPSIELTAMVGYGDGFRRVLERAGVAAAEAERAEALVGAVTDPQAIRPGTRLDVLLGSRADPTRPRPLESLAFRARFDLKLELRRVGGRLVLSETPIQIDAAPLRIQGRAGTSLYRSARAAGVPAKAIETYLRALATQIDVGEIGEDDQFDLVVEHRRAENGETETGALLYAGLERSGGESLQLMPWQKNGSVQWFEASGVGKAQGLLQRPVPGLVSSDFGLRRHPILGYTRMHKGVDFRAGYGTPILAATDGVIAAAGWAGGYGKQVRINHGGGITTSYSHMSRIVGEPGTPVRQGQLIGYVGSTGMSTGPHLHYELHVNGVAVDPASVQYATRSLLSGAELEAFRSRLRSLLAIRPGELPASGAGAVAFAP
jgi:murein DD-endopeptidase MepM/ murein hydrolase activator NlpD